RESRKLRTMTAGYGTPIVTSSVTIRSPAIDTSRGGRGSDATTLCRPGTERPPEHAAQLELQLSAPHLTFQSSLVRSERRTQLPWGALGGRLAVDAQVRWTAGGNRGGIRESCGRPLRRRPTRLQQRR